jgi:hypothetical protein
MVALHLWLDLGHASAPTFFCDLDLVCVSVHCCRRRHHHRLKKKKVD